MYPAQDKQRKSMSKQCYKIYIIRKYSSSYPVSSSYPPQAAAGPAPCVCLVEFPSPENNILKS